MLQCESYWVAWNFWISEGKVLADTEQTLEVDVGLHPDDDGGARGSHVVLSVPADENEGVGHRAGCRHCHSTVNRSSTDLSTFKSREMKYFLFMTKW